MDDYDDTLRRAVELLDLNVATMMNERGCSGVLAYVMLMKAGLMHVAQGLCSHIDDPDHDKGMERFAELVEASVNEAVTLRGWSRSNIRHAPLSSRATVSMAISMVPPAAMTPRIPASSLSK